jgi:hypothetical protein
MECQMITTKSSGHRLVLHGTNARLTIHCGSGRSGRHDPRDVVDQWRFEQAVRREMRGELDH